MNKRRFLILLFVLFAVAANAAPVPPATNKDGSLVSGFVTASFDLRTSPPAAPFPYNPLFDPSDLTLNIPPQGGDPSDFSDPTVAAGEIWGRFEAYRGSS